jgi:O-antigen/teichoic acid export membrane protein
MSTLVRALLLIAIRGLNTISKFALALYTARYLGLADLGIYGLMVAGTTILPAFAGLGTSDWIIRQIAGAATSRATPLIVTRLAMVLAFHLILQPVAFAANAFLGVPIAWPMAILLGLIAVLEHLGADAGEMLTFRGHAVFANVLMFLRSGLWPLGVIAAGLLLPAARSLEWLMIGWLLGLICMWLVLAIYVARNARWRHLGLDWRWMRTGIRASVPFYLKDMSIAANLYLDRFLVSLFLGLELAGVYTFFWSIANVVHNLALYGVFQPHVAKLIQAARGGAAEFQPVLRRIEIETGGFALMMAVGLIAAVPFLLPYLDRPLLAAHLTVFNIVVAATLLRLAADSYNFVLVALHHDRAMAVVSLLGVPLSAALLTTLIPLLGLNGAGIAYLVTGILLLAPRLVLSRRQMTFAS